MAASDGGKAPHPAARDPLVIRSLDFMGGMAEVGGWRPDAVLPEIAFAGRSNVGKSSLLNRLVRRKAFARVSKTPGRTREINFFRVNNEFVFADLPGYGYARISREKSSTWGPMIESYLRRSPTLRGVVQLLDVRHDPTDEDRTMLDFLADVGVPVMFVATKTDKLSKGAIDARITELGKRLDVPEEQIIPFSATTGAGRDELAEAIVSLMATPPEDDATDDTTDGVSDEETAR